MLCAASDRRQFLERIEDFQAGPAEVLVVSRHDCQTVTPCGVWTAGRLHRYQAASSNPAAPRGLPPATRQFVHAYRALTQHGKPVACARDTAEHNLVLFRMEPGFEHIPGRNRGEADRDGQAALGIEGQNHGGIVPPCDPKIKFLLSRVRSAGLERRPVGSGQAPPATPAILATYQRSNGMRWLDVIHAQGYNRRHERV